MMKSASTASIAVDPATVHSQHRTSSSSHRQSSANVEQDLAVAAASNVASSPDWQLVKAPSAAKSERPIPLEDFQAESSGDGIGRTPVSTSGDDQTDRRQSSIDSYGA